MESIHGGDIFKFAKEAKCSPKDVIDLSSNVNFIKPKIDIDFNSLSISPYPNYKKLTQQVAKYYRVKDNNLELFNGATVAIDTILKELREFSDICVIYSPAYLEYKRVAVKYRYDVKLFDRFLPFKSPPKGSVIVFVNPSTPDGVFYNIEYAIKVWNSLECKIVIDESFLDFISLENSIVNHLNRIENLFIIKSMTKFFGSAGIRVGALISNEKFISNLKVKEPLWKISSFDSAYILSALEDKEFINRSKEANLISKKYLLDGLESLRDKGKIVNKIYFSSVNFLLIRLKIEAKVLQDILVSQKIMVRDCSNFDYLDNYFIRVAVKDIDSLRKFINRLKNF